MRFTARLLAEFLDARKAPLYRLYYLLKYYMGCKLMLLSFGERFIHCPSYSRPPTALLGARARHRLQLVVICQICRRLVKVFIIC